MKRYAFPGLAVLLVVVLCLSIPAFLPKKKDSREEMVRICATLHHAIIRFYRDHQMEKPIPPASLNTLRKEHYLDETFLQNLTDAKGIYCLYLPPSHNPQDPLIEYFSQKWN